MGLTDDCLMASIHSSLSSNELTENKRETPVVTSSGREKTKIKAVKNEKEREREREREGGRKEGREGEEELKTSCDTNQHIRYSLQ